MDAPLSEIGIAQCKALSHFLVRHLSDLQRELQSTQNYLASHRQCDKHIHEASKILDNMLLPINSAHLQGQHGPNHSDDLRKMQLYLNRAKVELSTSINEFERKTAGDVERLQHLISIVSVLLTPSNETIVVCSNLRRAISTAIIALWDRFEADKSAKLYMVPCLQELGRNVDSISQQDTDKAAKESQLNSWVKGINQYLTDDGKGKKVKNGKSSKSTESVSKDSSRENGKESRRMSKIELSEFEEQCDDLNDSMEKVNAQKMRKFYNERLETIEMNCSLSRMGSAELKKKDKMENRKEGDKKIDLFMDWLFNDDSNQSKTTVVVIGHSAWIREFFRKYMEEYHQLKTEKLKNCGVVAVDVYRNFHFKNNKVNQYSVASVVPIYEGSL